MLQQAMQYGENILLLMPAGENSVSLRYIIHAACPG
jgi:hypothetical protein